MTKSQAISNYDRTPKFQTLFDVYKNPSREKERIDERIRRECDAIGGYDYRVINGNSYQFTCAFRFYNCEDKKEYLVYYTKENRYCYEYSTD